MDAPSKQTVTVEAKVIRTDGTEETISFDCVEVDGVAYPVVDGQVVLPDGVTWQP